MASFSMALDSLALHSNLLNESLLKTRSFELKVKLLPFGYSSDLLKEMESSSGDFSNAEESRRLSPTFSLRIFPLSDESPPF